MTNLRDPNAEFAILVLAVLMLLRPAPLAATPTHVLYMWGSNQYGQLATGGPTDDLTLSPQPTSRPQGVAMPMIRQLALGGGHSVGLPLESVTQSSFLCCFPKQMHTQLPARIGCYKLANSNHSSDGTKSLCLLTRSHSGCSLLSMSMEKFGAGDGIPRGSSAEEILPVCPSARRRRQCQISRRSVSLLRGTSRALLSTGMEDCGLLMRIQEICGRA